MLLWQIILQTILWLLNTVIYAVCKCAILWGIFQETVALNELLGILDSLALLEHESLRAPVRVRMNWAVALDTALR